MVSQLKNIAVQIRSKVDDVITSVKKNASSTPLDPDEQGTSSCSPEGAQPNDSERASRLIDSVMTTLFAACTGNNCPTNDEEMLVEAMQKKQKQPTKLGKKARNALRTLQNSSSRDECHYAQFYEDDHGMAARAVLMARKREDRERSQQRLKLKELHQMARAEAVSQGARNSNRKNKVPQQHLEKVQVDGDPYRLCEVGNGLNRSAASDDSASALSYNYDDGISAISANTLEEMAKAEILLQRKRGIPKEQGFEFVKTDEDNLPPSPASTVESSNASNDVSRTKIEPPESEKVVRKYKNDIENYPVQMARPRSHRSVATTGSSSQSEFMEWKDQDDKYWARVVEGEEDATNQQFQNITSPQKEQHPHDTSVLSTVSISSTQRKKKGRKTRTPKIFTRRKKNYWNEISNECDI